MSLSLTPISIPSSCGLLAGFKVPMTPERKLIYQIDLAIAPHMICKEGQLIGGNFSSHCVLQVISQLFLPKAVSQAYPSLPKVIHLKDPLFYCKIPSIENPSRDPIVKKVNEWLIEFFLRSPIPIFLTQEESLSLYKRLSKFCLIKLGLKEVFIPEQFSREDTEVLRCHPLHIQMMQQQQPKFRPRDFSCHEFTLLKIKEKGLFEYLMSQVHKQNFLDLLQKFGYQSVEDPQLNDIVVYLEKGALKHSGRYLGNRMVESKFGDEAQICYQHPLELVWEIYGTQLVFLRKIKNVAYESIPQILKRCFKYLR